MARISSVNLLGTGPPGEPELFLGLLLWHWLAGDDDFTLAAEATPVAGPVLAHEHQLGMAVRATIRTMRALIAASAKEKPRSQSSWCRPAPENCTPGQNECITRIAGCKGWLTGPVLLLQ